jgi:hypothetical protein
VVAPEKVALQNSLSALGLAIAVFLNPIVYTFMKHNNAFIVFFIYGAIDIVAIFIFSIVMV